MLCLVMMELAQAYHMRSISGKLLSSLLNWVDWVLLVKSKIAYNLHKNGIRKLQSNKTT